MPDFKKFASLDPEESLLPMVDDDAYLVAFGPISLKGSVEISSLILPDEESALARLH